MTRAKLSQNNSLCQRLVVLFSQEITKINGMRYGTIEIKVRDGKIVVMNANHTFNLEKDDLDKET